MAIRCRCQQAFAVDCDSRDFLPSPSRAPSTDAQHVSSSTESSSRWRACEYGGVILLGKLPPREGGLLLLVQYMKLQVQKKIVPIVNTLFQLQVLCSKKHKEYLFCSEHSVFIPRVTFGDVILCYQNTKRHSLQSYYSSKQPLRFFALVLFLCIFIIVLFDKMFKFKSTFSYLCTRITEEISVQSIAPPPPPPPKESDDIGINVRLKTSK